jgi:DNA-binding response OmpR family regulator
MEVGSSILIVDDDPRVCRLVARYLGREGYTVRTAASGAQMRQVMLDDTPQLVILDILLPDDDGFDLARELRASSDVGIIMLTGKTDTVDKIVGLEVGADDYITKPFDERELLARVRSVLRRVSHHATEPDLRASEARFAGWRLDLDGYELISPEGESIALTTHEFQLLAALVKHGERVLTRDVILDSVFGKEWAPYDRSVDVLVGKLRRKLRDDPRRPTLIRTVRGAGYRLIPKVQSG